MPTCHDPQWLFNPARTAQQQTQVEALNILKARTDRYQRKTKRRVEAVASHLYVFPLSIPEGQMVIIHL
jgi:hypothetical protein